MFAARFTGLAAVAGHDAGQDLVAFEQFNRHRAAFVSVVAEPCVGGNVVECGAS